MIERFDRMSTVSIAAMQTTKLLKKGEIYLSDGSMHRSKMPNGKSTLRQQLALRNGQRQA